MSIDAFLARLSASGDAERANKDSFLNELCDVLGVGVRTPRPAIRPGISASSSGEQGGRGGSWVAARTE